MIQLELELPGLADQVVSGAVAEVFPYGTVTVQVVPGGLDIPGERGGDRAVVATAAIVVSCPLP